jgi:hypothetical protein
VSRDRLARKRMDSGGELASGGSLANDRDVKREYDAEKISSSIDPVLTHCVANDPKGWS